MPICLEEDDFAFVNQVATLCQRGKSQPEIAREFGLSLSGLRNRLSKHGLCFGTRVERQLQRAGSGEPIADLIARGELIETASRERCHA